jgi:hypothetical protein
LWLSTFVGRACEVVGLQQLMFELIYYFTLLPLIIAGLIVIFTKPTPNSFFK